MFKSKMLSVYQYCMFRSSHALQIDHVRAERDVLAEVHNPYVVKLYYSFQVCIDTDVPSRARA